MSAATVDSGHAVTAEWVRSLPKAEIHVHLEAALDRAEFVEIAERAGVAVPQPYRTLPELLAYLDWTCGLLTTHEQLAHVAYRFAERKHRSGVRYADVVVNPTHWTSWHGRLGAMLDALDEGFARAAADRLTKVGLCVSLLRTQTAEQARRVVSDLLDLQHPRVVALSIDGNEAATGRTGERFAPAFAMARDGGLRTTAHAGESSGPEGVLDALDLLGAERIDHGVRAVEQQGLPERLAAERVPLGVTPLANIALGMWPDVSAHPIEELRRAGVRVSVNTDDPVCREHLLEDNFVRCAEAFGWDRRIVLELVRTGIEASFAAADEQHELLSDLEKFEETA